MTNEATSRGNAATFLLCFVAALIEGYDLQVAGVTAPRFAPAFGLSAAQLGWVFSSNTIGLFIGAALGGGLADRIGRKTVLIGSMVVFGVFTLGTAMASDAAIFIWMRFLTGLGLGGAMPNIIALVAETGSTVNRATKVTMLTAGIPFGGGIAGGIVYLAPQVDWRIVFAIGGVAPILTALAMLWGLRESRGYLAAQANRRAVREPVLRGVAAGLFGEGRAAATLLSWTSFFFTLLVLYLLLNWLPSLLIGKGFTQPEAVLASLMFTLGGGVGAIGLGSLARLGGVRLLYFVTYSAMAASLVLLAAVGRDFVLVLVSSAAAGVFVVGSQFLLYGLCATLYPVHVRGLGVGWTVAVGRLGAIAGPALAGVMLAAGRPPSEVFYMIIPIILLALVAVMLLVWWQPAEAGKPEMAQV
jgi:AAHS family 3-hydroxyphenylpropionic acid transporter